MKKTWIMWLIVVVAFVAGCDSSTQDSADRQQTVQTEKAMREANAQVGMPAIKNFQERKLAKMIFELRDQEKFICHAYLVNQMTGTVGQYLGKCLGYGLPYSVQFTNPEKPLTGSSAHGYGITTIPQPDPNGLFMPDGLSATWLMMLDRNGEARPVYVEPAIIVSPFPLHN